MRNLASFFEDLLKRKRHYVGVANGNQFENQIIDGLIRFGVNRVMESSLTEHGRNIKQILRQDRTDSISNPTSYESQFWHQPLGSQMYPDYVVFDGSRLVCIETKFSMGMQKKPVWNGGLPRQDGIYIFGAKGCDDITFFRGADVIDVETARKMHALFDEELNVRQTAFNSELGKQPYGFVVYVRKAFAQARSGNPDATLDFFSNPERERLERSVVDFAKREL